jgi:hypothetical protein
VRNGPASADGDSSAKLTNPVIPLNLLRDQNGVTSHEFPGPAD